MISVRELGNYFARRLEDLNICRVEVENNLVEEPKRRICELVDRGEVDRQDKRIGQAYHRIEYRTANTFRYSLLVSLCTYLEEAMKTLSAVLVPTYESRLKDEEKKNGSWLAKHRRILTDAGINLKPVEKELDTFNDFVTLRNCVVHQWGKVTAAKDEAAVREAVNRIETAEIFKDDYLYLGDQVLAEAILAAENIVEHLIELTGTTYKGRGGLTLGPDQKETAT